MLQVDDRSSKNLKELFTTINTNNSLKDVENDNNFVAFKNAHEVSGFEHFLVKFFELILTNL